MRIQKWPQHKLITGYRLKAQPRFRDVSGVVSLNCKQSLVVHSHVPDQQAFIHNGPQPPNSHSPHSPMTNEH